MSESNGTTKTGKPRRNWSAVRAQYERGTIGLRPLARSLGIPVTTLQQRAWREKWKRNDTLVRKTSADLETAITDRVKRQIESELAPWIEAEKIKFTKTGVQVAKTGIARVKRMFKANPKPESKSEAFISKAAETYHRMGRTALGLGDGSTIGGSLTMNILANQAAIAVSPAKQQ